MVVGSSKTIILLLDDSTRTGAEFVTEKVKKSVQVASRQDHLLLTGCTMHMR